MRCRRSRPRLASPPAPPRSPPAGGGVDQHPLIWLQPAHGHQGRVCGRVVDRERRPLLERELLRQGKGLVGRNGDQLGVAAEARAGHHPIAGLDVLHPVANALHLAGDLVADHARRRRGIRVHASRAIRSAKLIPAAFTATRTSPAPTGRVRAFLHLEHLGPTVLGDHHGAHRRGPYDTTTSTRCFRR